jgi:hypothetical protein
MRSTFVGHALRKGGRAWRVSGRFLAVYERFLESPVVVVLVVLWLAGVTLLGSLAPMLFLVGA